MRHRRGVTLIELLLVIVILGALVAIALPRMCQSAQNAKANTCATNIEIMNTQIELYAGDNNGSYPATLATITADPNTFPDGAPTCPLGGTYTMSATTHRVSCSH
jgi:prepilin-type N-terminal cleavage/methylation domain-containing protein